MVPNTKSGRLSLLRRAHDYHRDLRTRLPAAAVAYPIDRARQLMTITLVSPSSIAASVRHRYLTGTGPPPPTITLSAAFGWQNPEHRLPDHCADRIQGSQNQRPAGHSTLVPVWNRQIRSSPGAKSP